MKTVPYFISDNKSINHAYRLAIATVGANILPFRDGLLTEPKPVFIAGLGYVKPWTRDAAINTWNGGGLIYPEVARNTLLSVLDGSGDDVSIKGEYWDRIIFAVGAWYYYLYTADRELLSVAYKATKNTIKKCELEEFSEDVGLFRGPACYGDGVAAYPDVYAAQGESGIIAFATEFPKLCAETGVGIPMHVLSTNCLYCEVYRILDLMADELSVPRCYEERYLALRAKINEIFWSEKLGSYTYIHDKFGGCDRQEGIGISFAALFGIADGRQCKRIFENHRTTERGIACVYPGFKRYSSEDGMSFGRHCGTVWPHIQGFFADAAKRCGRDDLFEREFRLQTENALRYYQFAEIYHPITGEMYGGVQEWKGSGLRDWRSEPYQTWSATAYLRGVYNDIMGMEFDTDGIRFTPVRTSLIGKAELTNLHYRECVLNIRLSGGGGAIKSFTLDGAASEPFISKELCGTHSIEIVTE